MHSRRNDEMVLSEYLALLEYKLQRREELDRKIEELALQPAYKPVVDRLKCFRGLDTHAAMVLATEIGDWRRFENPRQLMAYLGLVPSEHSSGERRRQGSITKCGNSHCRHVLVQAAWNYRSRPIVGIALKRRQRGQSPQVIAHAWKAQHRLHKLFVRIAARKGSPIAAVAVAWELVGFVWAVLQDVEAKAQEPSSPEVGAGTRLHHDAAGLALAPEALELRAREAVTLGDAVVLIGHGELEDVLGQVDGDGYAVHCGLLSLGVPYALPR